MSPSFLTLAIALTGTLFQTGCSKQSRIKAETKVADMLISVDQEKEIGKQMHQEIKKEMTLVTDPKVTDYVEGIGQRVFAEAKRQNIAEDIKMFVIDDDKTVNAFAIPGGRIYVYTGLLLEADNEAEVAAVIGHEGGHVIARHAARQMVYTYGYSGLASIALGQNPSQLQQIAAQLVGQGFIARHSQSEETEADRLGLRYTAGAGYDPEAMVTFFQKLNKMDGQTSAVASWFSSHPQTEDRIAEVRTMIKNQNLDGGEEGTEDHQAVVAQLR